jgi:hypothetical protein
MKHVITKITSALALTIAALGAHAAVVGPTDMRITAGSWLNGFPGVPPFPVTLLSSNDITDQYNPAGWDLGVSQPTGVLALGATLSFQVGTDPGSQVNGFFAASVAGVNGGGSFPVFDGLLIDGNVSDIDMRSFFISGFGTSNQGNASLPSNGNNPLVTNLTMSGCVSGISCNWTMSWQVKVLDGAFKGNTQSWQLSGTITAVPEVSTYSMLLSGLGLVGLVVHRRRQQAMT